MRLAVGLNAKFVRLLSKLTLQNKNKSETSGIRKGILNCSSNLVVYLIEFESFSKQYVGSTFIPSHSRFNTYKSALEKCQKFIPRKVMSIKNNFIVTLTLRDTTEWQTGRLLSLIGLKMI